MNDNALAKEYSGISLIKYAIPTIIMMIFGSTAGIIDGIFVAQFTHLHHLTTQRETLRWLISTKIIPSRLSKIFCFIIN